MGERRGEAWWEERLRGAGGGEAGGGGEWFLTEENIYLGTRTL